MRAIKPPLRCSEKLVADSPSSIRRLKKHFMANTNTHSSSCLDCSAYQPSPLRQLIQFLSLTTCSCQSSLPSLAASPLVTADWVAYYLWLSVLFESWLHSLPSVDVSPLLTADWVWAYHLRLSVLFESWLNSLPSVAVSPLLIADWV